MKSESREKRRQVNLDVFSGIERTLEYVVPALVGLFLLEPNEVGTTNKPSHE
jgi:hypothetical protein